MRRYQVQLVRDATQLADIEVEASDPDEAERLALDLERDGALEDEWRGGVWEINVGATIVLEVEDGEEEG